MYQFKLSIEQIRTIIYDQFPQYSHLKITAVDTQGNDNRTYRLGNDLIIRFPAKEAYATHIPYEHAILNRISQYTQMAPKSLHLGQPSALCPFSFVINTYIHGDVLNDNIVRTDLVNDLFGFLQTLHSIPTHNLPEPGKHNFYRGCHPNIYIDSLRAMIKEYNIYNTDELLQRAQNSFWTHNSVVIHGDLMPSNIIIKNDRLDGIIDWGTSAIGDPSCDLIILWTYFNRNERRLLKKNLIEKNIIDKETYIRGAMWALWKILANIKCGSFDKQYGLGLVNEIVKEFYTFTLSIEQIRTIIYDQFPQYSHLKITAVDTQGNDNRTYRLGNDLIIRFPAKEAYATHIPYEHAILNRISQYTQMAPKSLHLGKPSALCPFSFVINTYIDGEILNNRTQELIEDFCMFFQTLHSIPTHDLPEPGEHNFYRGCHPNIYIDSLRAMIEKNNIHNTNKLLEQAENSTWNRRPVIIHGDLISVFKGDENVKLGNLITHDGRLKGVIDWGVSAVGDPSCDLVILWTYFTNEDRQLFKKILINQDIIDDDTYIRGGMWALWQVLTNLTKGFFEPNYGLKLAHEIVREFSV